MFTNYGVTVAGDTVIGSIRPDSGIKITLGKLAENASITVAAIGAFTEAGSRATEYAKYVKSAEGYKDITAVDNAPFAERAAMRRLGLINPI